MEESFTQWIVKHTVYRFLRWKCGGSHREARTSNCTHRQSQPGCHQGQSCAGATNHQKPSSNISCQEPPREIPPMTKSCGRDLMSKADQNSRDPLNLLKHLAQNQNLSTVIILCLSPTLLSLTGGYSRPPFSGKNQLRALVNKSPGHDRSVSIQTPLMAF